MGRAAQREAMPTSAFTSKNHDTYQRNNTSLDKGAVFACTDLTVMPLLICSEPVQMPVSIPRGAIYTLRMQWRALIPSDRRELMQERAKMKRIVPNRDEHGRHKVIPRKIREPARTRSGTHTVGDERQMSRKHRS